MSGFRKFSIGLLVVVFAVAVLAYYNIRRIIVHGHSMDPTFHTGQSVIIWTTVPRDSLKIGDVVVLMPPDNQEIIKRIVFIQNAQGTAQPPEMVWTPTGQQHFSVLFDEYALDHVGNKAVPPVDDHRIYVMGDNYEISQDSRDFGPVAPKQIIGKVIR